MNNIRLRLLGMAAAGLLSACAATPQTHFYVLDALSRPPQMPAVDTPRRLIGLGPVSVPALLERRQIVTRSGDNRITASEQHQWAAPLQASITETLAQNLSLLLPRDVVKAYPWSAYGDMDVHVIVDIVRFETTAAHNAELLANWSIMNDQTHALLEHGQAAFSRAAGSGYPDAVQALSATLADFSAKLATALMTLKTDAQQRSIK